MPVLPNLTGADQFTWQRTGAQLELTQSEWISEKDYR
jgi:hypothetical protein